MSSVFFSYTTTQEKEYLNKLFEERRWFKSEKFDAFLPKNKDSIEKEVINKNDPLSKKIIWLRKEWKKIERDYFKVVKKFQHAKFSSRYKCHVSRFDPEGKYTRPDMLFVRLRNKQDKKE